MLSNQQVFSHLSHLGLQVLCLSFLLLLRFFLTPQQMQWPLCSDEPGFFHIYFPYRKTPFKCIVFIQLEYCFHFDYLVPQPPHPSTSSIPTVRWNDIQKYSTSIDKNKSAVKLLYWPPHPAFLDSLRQFTPAPPCPVQARKYNNTQRERETGGNSLLSILTKSLYKSETTARSVQHIVTL